MSYAQLFQWKNPFLIKLEKIWESHFILKLKILTAEKMNLQTSKHYCHDPMFADSVVCFASFVVVVTVMVKLLVNHVLCFYYCAKSVLY